MEDRSGIVDSTNKIKSYPISIQDRINQILTLDEILVEILAELKTQGIDQLIDTRSLFVRFLSELNTITVFQLSFHAESYEKLSKKDWLKQRLPAQSLKIDGIKDFNEYMMRRSKNSLKQIWDCFFLTFFREFETRIRNIVRQVECINNLQATKSKKKLIGHESFYYIYRGLYESYLRMEKSQYEVLKIFTAIRNTVHNSGIYYSTNKKNMVSNYSGRTYRFRHGYPVSFLNEELRISILTDLTKLFLATIKHQRIKKILVIKDPFSEIEFD